MKKLVALFTVLAVPVFAVDFEKVVDANFSVPSSVKPAMQKIDRNLAAAKTAIDAAQTADADLTDLADGSLTGSKVGTGIAAGNVTTGMLPATVLTNAMTVLMEQFIQSGTCTNGQTISFTPAFSSTPMVAGAFFGVPRDGNGALVTNAVIYISSVSANSFVLDSITPCTNKIHWTAINVP